MSLYKKINSFGDVFWYKDGSSLIHREDGPAIEYANGSKFWYMNGRPHREDGPAYISRYGIVSWYYYVKYIKCSSHEEFLRIIKLKAFW